MDEATARALDRLLAAARADPDALAVLLFGSAARGEEARDVDVAVVLHPDSRAHPQDKLLEYAAFASGRRHEGLDVSVYQGMPLYVRQAVLKDHRVLFCRDEDVLFDVGWGTLREWRDFRPRLELYLGGAWREA